MFRNLPASLPILFVSEIIFILGYGLFLTLVSVRMSIEGFAPSIAGLMMSAGAAGFVAGSFVLVRFIQSVGHVRVFAACSGLLAVTTLFHSLYIDAWAWGFLRVISGFGTAGVLMVMESWVSEVSSNLNRGRILGLYLVISTISLAGGQWLLNAADPAGFQLFSLAAIFFALALVPLALYRLPGTRTEEEPFSPLSLRELFRLVPVGIVGAVVAGMMVHAFFAMAPFYSREAGFTTAETARYMALTTLIAMLAQWVLGRVSDYFDRRRVIGLMSVFMGVAGLAVAAASGRGFWMVLALTCLLTAFVHTLYSLCIAHTNDHMRAEEVVPAASGLLLSYGIGSVIGPWLASLLMGLIGPAGLFVFLALNGFGLGAFILRGPRSAQGAHEHNDYVHVMPATDATPVLAGWDMEPDDDEEEEIDYSRVWRE